MLTKRETLRAMGIEVWSLRSEMTAASLGQPKSDVVDTRSSAKSLTPIDALKAQLSPRGEDSGERSNGQSPAAAALALTTADSSGVETPVQKTAQPSNDKTVPSFRYALLHYDSVGLCISLAEKSEVPRRLCDDIARLMGGDIKAAKYQELKWPMLSNSGIDQSLSAARQVVTEKFRLLPQKVIVIGADVGDCFKPVEDLTHMSHGRFGSQAYFLIDSADALVSSSETKRRLMMALLAWR